MPGILISKTYSETTPESVENGNTSDTGFVFQDVEHSFSELVDLLRDHTEPSCYPAAGDRHEWYSSGYRTECYRTGTDRETSIHFSRKNPDRKERYWKLAAKAAGIVK